MDGWMGSVSGSHPENTGHKTLRACDSDRLYSQTKPTQAFSLFLLLLDFMTPPPPQKGGRCTRRFNNHPLSPTKTT